MKNRSRVMCALVAGLTLFIPALASAEIVTITGRIANIYQGGSALYEDFAVSKAIGSTYTITLAVENGSVTSVQYDNSIPGVFSVFDNGVLLAGSRYYASSVDDGSGQFDVRSINVSLRGAGLFYRDIGSADLGGAGIEIILVPQGVQGVPEPATWAMMLLGLGAVGSQVRRLSRPRPRPDAARYGPLPGGARPSCGQ